MKVIQQKSHSLDPEALYVSEIFDPVPVGREVLIDVHYAGINRADILQRKGKYPPPPGASPILGLEVSGVIEAVGPECSADWKIGQEVCTLLDGGGYAEKAVAREEMLIPLPKDTELSAAAGMPEAFLTAFQALYQLANNPKRHSILIHAGASGVGTAAIQLARLYYEIIIVTASASKHVVCENLGANFTIDYKKEDFARVILDRLGLKMDLIIDFIGAPYFHKNVEVLNTDGCMVGLAFLGGSDIEKFSLIPLLQKRISLKYSTLRSRSLEYKINLTTRFKEECHSLFEDKKIQVIVDSIWPMTQVPKAHLHMEHNLNKGKIILQIK